MNHERFGSCIDGKGIVRDHFAEGWLRAPDGRKISPMCRHHAQEVIDEYQAKLGETWAFDSEA